MISPRLTNCIELSQLNQGLGVHCFVVIDLLSRVGDEEVDAYFAFGLKAVGGKPTQVVVLVDGVEIVVVGRIEGHTNVLWREVRVGGGMVAGHEDVVSTHRFLTVGCVVDGESIGHNEGVVGVLLTVDVLWEQGGAAPTVYLLGGSEDVQMAILLPFAEVDLVAQFGFVHHVAFFVLMAEVVGVAV